MADFTISDKTQAQTLATGAMFLVETGTAGQYGKFPWSILSGQFSPASASNAQLFVGTGNPNSFVTANSGSLFIAVDEKLLWMNLSGGNNSWV